MARSMNQKLKVLYIIRLLARTDEAHVVTMNEILEELKSHDIPAERKSIYDDLDALRLFGLDVIGRRERPAGYYLKDRERLAGLLALPEKPETLPEKQSAPSGETKSFGWLKGKTKIEISCGRSLSEQLINQLGDGISVKNREAGGKKDGQAAVILKLKADPGEDFYGWLAGFGCSVKLLSPLSAVKGYRKYLKEIRNMYKED